LFLPSRAFAILGVQVGLDKLIVVALALASAGGLAAFFRYSRMGVSMRAVVDDPSLLALAATSPTRVRRLAWGIGSAFAAGSAILIVPSLGLDAGLLTLLVVQAFGAAAIGAFSSLPWTYFGGLVVGIGAALTTKYVAHTAWLAGLPPSFPFLVLFVALVALPKRLLVHGQSERRIVATWRRQVSTRTRTIGYAGLLALLIAVPFFAGTRQLVYTNGLIFAVVFLSLHLLVRTSGQVSIAHAGFAAVGASTFANLSHGAGLPWLVALLLAGLVTVPVGAVVALPAIRLSGVYLAVATFGFGIILQRIFFQTSIMFGSVGTRIATRPDLPGIDLTTDRGFYFVVLGVVVCMCALTMLVHRSRLGRLLRSLAGSPLALELSGASVNLTKVLVFCISAFMAGIAGALFASLAVHISTSGFDSSNSLLWLAVLVIAGSGEVVPAFIAGAALAVFPSYISSYVSSTTLQNYLPVIFGVSAIFMATARRRRAGGGVRRLLEGSEGRAIRSPSKARTAAARQSAAAPVATTGLSR
jgi:ABC-type branched-subunit amino acid transport system permease subunit